MKNILIPTDFSNDAYNALFYASNLFKTKTCNFYLLNAYSERTPILSRNLERGEGNGNRKGLLEQLKDESCEELKRTFHKINLDNKCRNHTYELISKRENLIEAISKTVDDRHIDLIVMGNKGETNGFGLFLGSSTTKAIASIKKCPILSVPMDAEFKMPYEIAFITGFKRTFDAEVLHPLKEMAAHCGSAIRIAHINEEEILSKQQESNLETLKTYLNPIGHSLHWMPDFASKTRAIEVFLEELNIGMVAMVNYDHNFFENLVKEPIIQKLACKIAIPFLVIPGKT
ncbi:universal stress protein [Maribacter polysaccharolyticus]|uniref:universal stress protein n=1 Tax=Maribacter polysaccharolyticus TaxID=3020831 RepID=UPI00237F4CB9|nr:universal stress protein [Maribacter polysaccharolyticus]MDE3740838.1 universal stress protein [Maribacter polysaccharolyticus]